jgi:tRNA/rRNA methyltransferase
VADRDHHRPTDVRLCPGRCREQHALTATAPSIILVEPQLGENIGFAARAMANFGLADLRLVAPRDGWPNAKARTAASGADRVIEAVRIFDSVEAAVADLDLLYATTARVRDLTKPVLGPVAATEAMRTRAAAGVRAGILFGRERTGLTNAELALADALITLPVDPAFASLNIAQAVLILGYEWRKGVLAGDEADALPFAAPERSPTASKADLVRMMEHLEAALDAAGFFRPAEKRAHMVQNLRAIFARMDLTEQEIRTLRGVIAALERPAAGRNGG